MNDGIEKAEVLIIYKFSVVQSVFTRKSVIFTDSMRYIDIHSGRPSCFSLAIARSSGFLICILCPGVLN